MLETFLSRWLQGFDLELKVSIKPREFSALNKLVSQSGPSIPEPFGPQPELPPAPKRGRPAKPKDEPVVKKDPVVTPTVKPEVAAVASGSSEHETPEPSEPETKPIPQGSTEAPLIERVRLAILEIGRISGASAPSKILKAVCGDQVTRVGEVPQDKLPELLEALNRELLIISN